MIESLLKGRKKVSNQLKSVRFKLKHKKLEKKSLEDIETYQVLKASGVENVSVSPKYSHACHEELSYPEVDIRLYQLRNVYCNIEGANFISQDLRYVYIEEFPYVTCQEANYKAGFLVRHDTQDAYIKNIKKNTAINIKSALFLGGNGSFNFYHWMLEIAPKLLQLSDQDMIDNHIDTIVVNQCVEDNDNYRWILEQCVTHLNHINIIYAKPSELYFIENLFFINTFNQTVFNYNSDFDRYRTLTIFNYDSVMDFRKRLLQAAKQENKSFKLRDNKKIFILRSKDSVSAYNRRDYNQDEVFEFFKNEGFEGFYPDQFSLSEQISVFNNAEFIVGPTGASWSNLLFTNKGTKAISWLPKQLKYFDTYCSLAHLMGLDMHFLQYETIGRHAHGPYNLDINDVKMLYQNMK